MWIALVAAIAAAFTNASGALLQEQRARTQSQEKALRPKLLKDLATDRKWLAGIALTVTTFGLQAVALAFAPLAFVQPLLLMRLPFAIPLSARMRRDRMGKMEWLGLLFTAGGLALFLPVASPRAGDPLPGIEAWLWVGAVVLGAVSASLLLARGDPSPRRAVMLGTAAGVLFGTQAVLTRSLTELFQQGFGELISSWIPWSLAVVAFAAMVVQQSAYQAGSFAAARPPMDAAQLFVAIGVGILAFHEEIRTEAWAAVLQVVAISSVLSGIVVLARSPLVQQETREQEKREQRGETEEG